ncbi:MAG: MopE-related protein [Planctomycetota bacterium]|jgi:hypothetical protein
MKKSFFNLHILAVILLFTAVKIEAAEVTAFKQTYYRGTGTPVTEAGTFHKINGLAKIRVTNGGLEDADNEMVSSSEISLNGEFIISSSNFNQNVGVIQIEKNLSGGINTIEIILKGKPGGALTVQVLADASDIDLDDDSFTGNEGDCNDNDASINPAALEVCDGVDNNCDGQIDEGVTTTFYADSDSDGYGDPNATTDACQQPSGYVTDNTDCDDNDVNEHPGQTWYKDSDNDGYSDGTTDTASCTRPSGYKIAIELTATTGDCNDDVLFINPAAQEICDGVDNNCNGQIDEGVMTTYYHDVDTDGYGNPNDTTGACQQPSGYVTDNTDCDDDDVNEHPNQTWYKDVDGDLYSDGTTDTASCTRPDGYKTATELTSTTGDCNDNIDSIYPGVTETSDNGIDEDCNGLDTVTVPNVIGVDQATAESNITAANLVVVTVTTDNSDTVPAGDVISQVPAGNTLVQEGTSVDLVVSLGSSGPTLSSLQIFPSTLVLTAQGEVHQLTVTGVYSDNSTKDMTSSADGTTYATTDVNIADITTEGLAVANNDGPATITISNNAISAQLVVTVNIQTTPPYDPTAYITGIALDYYTGLPLVDADIKTLTLATEVSTDADGKFLYPVPQGGKYILFIEKPGYITAKKEIIVDSGKNTSIEESLTPYETYRTHIDAAVGGTATNEAGTIEMIFPPGALPYDIDISATRLEKEGYPVPEMKGQEFIDSVQFEPEHIDFNSPVTVRFSNIWGFTAGTPIPYAFGSHEDHDHEPEFPYFDPGMGQVSADGQWVDIVVSHFSCPSLVLPSCNAGSEGGTPSKGPQNPDVDGDDNKPDDPCNPTKEGTSAIYESSGVLQIRHDMVPYQAMGRSNGFSMIYRTDTVNVGSVLAIKESNNLSVDDMPSQTTFKVDVEGVTHETHILLWHTTLMEKTRRGKP